MPAVPSVPASSSLLLLLDDDALAEVLRAAKAAKVFTALANSSRRLCTVARSRVRTILDVKSEAQAALLLRSSTHSVPAFSACTHLDVEARLSDDDSIVIPALQAAVHLTALWEVHLHVYGDPSKLFTQVCDTRMGRIIDALPATLLHLRKLYLHVSGFGASSAQSVARLVQLTQLTIHTVTSDPEEFTAAAAAAADLTSLSCLTNLRDLQLWGPPPVQPAAGPGGPFSIPSSVTTMELGNGGYQLATIGCWVTHLPGCPQLQNLDVLYNHQEHSSACPAALAGILGQHNRQLRTLNISSDGTDSPDWYAQVEGLPDPDEPTEWHPDVALAALTGLECLYANDHLVVTAAAEWQHLAQLSSLTELTGAIIRMAPSQLDGASLALRELRCEAALGGADLGEVLLACPHLQRAWIHISSSDAPLALSPAATTPLRKRAGLKELCLGGCYNWGPAAAAQFAQLAPVLSGLPSLNLTWWPGSSGSEQGMACALPNLSSCTALTSLAISLRSAHGAIPQEEDWLLMLAPVLQLRHLQVRNAPTFNARAVVPLQGLLPQLQRVRPSCCGKLLPAMGHAQQQDQQVQEQAAKKLVAKVRQLLRPGLVLEV